MLSLLQGNKEHYCLHSYRGAPLRTLMGTKSSIAGQSAKCCCFILKSAWGSGVYVDVLFQCVVVNSFQSNLAQNSRMCQLTQLFWMTVLSFIHALVCTNASRFQDQLVCLSVTNFSLWSCGDSPPHSTAESFKRRDTKHTKFMRKHHVQKHFYTDAPKCRGSDFSPCRHEPERVCFYDIKLHHFPQMNLYVKNAQCLLHLKGLCFTF